MTVCVWINDDDDMILANTLLLLNSKESTQRQEKFRMKERTKTFYKQNVFILSFLSYK